MDSPASNRLRRGRVSIPGQLYLLTTTVNQREPLFRNFALARLMIDQLRYAERTSMVRSMAWVVMPDHLHWLIALEQVSLSTLMRKVKCRSTCLINKASGRTGRLWQQGFHDRALRREEHVLDVARYIVANPVRAGLVSRVGDYPHWDAVWL